MQKLAEYQLDCEKTDKQLIISTVKEIESRRRSVCLGGERTLHISPEGFFYPCSHLVGNSLYICLLYTSDAAEESSAASDVYKRQI